MLKYKSFSDKLFESAPRIPISEDYWIKKGKIGKEVMLFFHDDLDGIFSAVAMKNYLLGKGFKLHGYGIVNYQEGWSTTELDDKYINIALDYAENVDGINIYMDHHGEFMEEDNEERNRGEGAVKTDTGSAYEGIMDQLGLPIDSGILNVIDMVDSAKYDDYKIKQEVLLKFDPGSFKNKLEFAAAFNQLLKRSDHRTFIEVVANSKDIAPSIYNIYRLFRLLYPANNLNIWDLKKAAKQAEYLDNNGKPDVPAYLEHLKLYNRKLLKSFEKDFIGDARWRLGQMQKKTRGYNRKEYIRNQTQFQENFTKASKYGRPIIKLDGYQILGTMVFVPSGTWANALRARSIFETDTEIINEFNKQFNEDRVPTIEYNVLKESPIYNKLEPIIGQKVELTGDLDYQNNPTIKITKNVTTDSSIEGITGFLSRNKEKGIVFRAKQPIFWILLQYGNTLQVCSYHKLDKYPKEYLPKTKDGKNITNLGKYTQDLLYNMAKYFGYNINIIPETTTKAGGHVGIGSISNIFGKVQNDQNIVPEPGTKNSQIHISNKSFMKKYYNTRFLDLIKNKMIEDLSEIPWGNLKMTWGDPEETPKTKPKTSEMNKKVVLADEIRKEKDVIRGNKELKEPEDSNDDKIIPISLELPTRQVVENKKTKPRKPKYNPVRMIDKKYADDYGQKMKKYREWEDQKNLLREFNSYTQQVLDFIDYPWQEDNEIEFVSLLDEYREEIEKNIKYDIKNYLKSMNKENQTQLLHMSDGFLTAFENLLK